MKRLIPLLLLAGCVSQRTVFTPYQERFAEEQSARNAQGIADARKVRIEYGKPRPSPLSQNNVAECKPISWASPATIVVDALQWAGLTEIGREVLIFHELGHCALGRGHSDGVMSPSLVDSKAYSETRAQMLDKLFEVK